jgi:hypothetical protein
MDFNSYTDDAFTLPDLLWDIRHYSHTSVPPNIDQDFMSPPRHLFPTAVNLPIFNAVNDAVFTNLTNPPHYMFPVGKQIA